LAEREMGRTVLMEVVDHWPDELGEAEGEKPVSAGPTEGQKAEWLPAHEVLRLRRKDYPAVLRLLLEHGADINAQDYEGQTALLHAVQRRSVNAVAALLQAGADIAVENNEGRTALDYLDDQSPPQLRTLLEQAGQSMRKPSAYRALLDAIEAGDAVAVQT